MAGEGAGKSGAEISGAAKGVSLESKKELHPCELSLRHPEIPQHSSQHPSQPFSGSPCLSAKVVPEALGNGLFGKVYMLIKLG